ncbi:MAG: hypothetical protein ACYSW3_25270 [Planctomycetota bacterium]|jgi:hypothetical protein
MRKTEEQKIRTRDDNLLRNEKSWRRARIGAIFLSIMYVLVIVILQRDEFSSPEEQEKCFVALGKMILFWLLIVSWLNLRLGHIESIKLYRKKEPEAVKGD